MRYILNNEGYIYDVSFGAEIECDLGTCTEYKGEVPEGYETIEEWYEEESEKLNAWKIVEGNLVFDENRYEELQTIYEKEAENNTLATHKWVNDKLNKINTTYDDELAASTSGSMVRVFDAQNGEIPRIKLTTEETINGKLKIKVSNMNLIEIKAISQTINGLGFNINEEEGSITVHGTATADTEFILNGSLTSTDELFFLKKNTDYYYRSYLSSENVKLNLYNYDGTSRELIYSQGGNDVHTINFSDNKYITCVSLTIPSGTTFDREELEFGITIVSGDGPAGKGIGNKIAVIDLDAYDLTSNDYLLIERGNVTLHKSINRLYPGSNTFPGARTFTLKREKDIELSSIDGLFSLEEDTIIQCDQDVYFDVKYFTKDALVEKVAKIETGQGNILLEVNKKVGKEEVIASINMSTETDEKGSSLKLKADKISLEGYTTINNNFSIDDNGNAILNGGNINLKEEELGNSKFTISCPDGEERGYGAEFNSYGIRTNIHGEPYREFCADIKDGLFCFIANNGELMLNHIADDPINNTLTYSIDDRTIIDANYYGVTLYNGSLEKLKKNIKKYDLGLELIKNTDIYTYNYKNEDDKFKKHIGVVIGDKYRTPKEILNNSNDGTDTYSMVSVCFNAIKQLNAKIETLENKIKEMESDK